MKSKVVIIALLLTGCVCAPKVRCDLEVADKAKVISNVWLQMENRYPGHSDYCATDKSADQFSFYSEKGECRVYLPCSESNAKGQTLLHGDWIVTFNPKDSEVKKFYDVAW